MDKKHRGITHGKFAMDPERIAAVKHNGQHQMHEYRKLVDKN